MTQEVSSVIGLVKYLRRQELIIVHSITSVPTNTQEKNQPMLEECNAKWVQCSTLCELVKLVEKLSCINICKLQGYDVF